MTSLPQPQANYRSPRVRLESVTPTVLRLPDGCRTQGELQVMSLTGGLVRLSKPLDRGSRVKLMFLTHAGAVMGGAEMLNPVSWGLQPFRFVSLEEADQRKLRTAIQSSLAEHGGEEQWIEKYRAALTDRTPPRRRLFRVFLGALTLVTLCLGSAIYILHAHLLK